MEAPESTRSVALTNAQLEVAIASLVAPGSALGVTGGTMDMRGPLNHQAFVEAVKAANRETDALNLCFRFEGDQIRQSLRADHHNVAYAWHDLAAASDPAAQMQDIIQHELRRGIELLSDAPRLRCYFFRLGEHHLHYLMLTHHAMIDGWGFSVWVQLLAQIYAGQRPAPAVPGFLEHARKLEAGGNGAAHQRSLAYWLEKLPAPPAALFQPARPAELDVTLTRFTLLPERTAPWTAWADAHGVSMPSLVTAALLLELAAATGQARPVIGLPVHRRNTPAAKQTVGLFASIMPLVVSLDRVDGPVALAQRIQQVQRGDFRHSGITLAEICRAWALGGIQSDPLQVTLSFEQHDYNVDLSGCELRIEALAPANQSRPLQIYWRQYQDGQPVLIDFSVNNAYVGTQVSPRILERMFARLDHAAGLTPLALEAPVQAASASAPQPVAAPLPHASLWNLFEHACRQHPDAIALVDEEGQRLSYAELHRQSANVARRLRALNLAPEAFVGLCARRNARLVVSLLGILASGCAYVPIDPGYPPERLRYLAADSGIRFVLADDPAALAALNLTQVQVLAMADMAANGAPAASLPAVQCGQAAYVIYTSGSTGQPKGCVVTHGNVLALLAAVAPLHRYGADDVWSLFHSYAFDFSVWELWGALAFGGRVVVVSQATSRDPDAFYQLLLRERVTVLSQTPTAFRSLIAHSDWLEEGAEPLALRRVIFGGEALDPNVLRPCFERLGDTVAFTNMYGITETTVHVTHRDIRGDETQLGSVIGPALPHWRLYVLDARLEPVAPGEIGEIYVGGLGVARGYHRRARLTAERMLPDVFQGDGSRMYRSGDLARLRHDGEIEYAGRMDHQVKIRGFRIELGEIEAALRQLAGIGDAVVLPWREHTDEELRLVAWVTPGTPSQNSSAQPDETALREQLAQSLPAHMVPARFVAIAALPRTVNGKLDRQALPSPARRIPPAAIPAPAAPEQTLHEEIAILTRLWKDVLGRDATASAHFFALGGDSLTALRMVARLRHLGYELSLADVFRHPELSACARKLRRLESPRQGDAATAPARALPEGVEDIFPMMALQAGMMYHTELAPESSVFQDVFDFEIRHPWDAERFQRAWDSLVAWSPALRTRFDWDGYDQPSLLIQKTARLPLHVIDLRGLPPAHQRALVEQASEDQRTRGFDFGQAPLMRVAVHLLDDQRFWLTVGFHHAVLDGWSFATLVATVLGHYMGELDIAHLPRDQALQKTASLHEQAMRQNPELRAFWLDRLKALPEAAMQPAPQASRTSAHRRERMARLHRRYEADALSAITAASIRAGVPLRSALLGVHLLAQMSWRQTARVTSGCVLNCRPEAPGADQAVGMFLNTLPLAARMPGDTVPVSDWLRALAAEEADILAHRWMPLAELLRLGQTDALFDCAFNFVHFHIYGQRMGAKIGTVNGYQVFERTDFPLLCQFSIEPATHTLELTLCSNLEGIGDVELARMEALYARCLQWLSTCASLGAPDFFVERDAPASAAPQGTDIIVTRAPDSTPETWSALEREIAALWSGVLATPVTDRDASFFELGGDSIAATRLVSLLRKQHAPQVRLKDFFARPTVRGVAATLAQMRSQAAPAAAWQPGLAAPIPKAARRAVAQHAPGSVHPDQQPS